MERGDATLDIEGLRRIQLAHLEYIAFENLDIVFAHGVVHDRLAAVDKIVDAGRGGWCFELNGALSLLLESLGFEVRLLGAAVLLGGPTTIIEHLLLEVAAPQLAPHLADVGFGASFDLPLELNTAGPRDGASGDFELIASPQGTTLTRHVDGVPDALLRFKRVAHEFDDFAAIARSLQVDPDKKWATHPFATRRLGEHSDGGPGRVTLSHDRLKIEQRDRREQRQVDRREWEIELARWFDMTPPGPWPQTPPDTS